MVTIQDARGGSVLIKKSDMALFFLLWLENLNVKEEEGGVGTWLTDMGKTHYLRFQRRHFTGLRGCHSSQPIYLDFFFVLFHTQYLHTAPISSLGGGGGEFALRRVSRIWKKERIGGSGQAHGTLG